MGDGIKMYFNGLITEQQLIAIIIGIIALVIVISIAKKVVKIVLIVAICIAGLVYFNVVSPDKLVDMGKVVQEYGEKAIEAIAEESENISIDYNDSELILKIRPDKCEDFININDFTKVIDGKDSMTLVNKDGNSFITTDANVIKLLKMFKK